MEISSNNIVLPQVTKHKLRLREATEEIKNPYHRIIRSADYLAEKNLEYKTTEVQEARVYKVDPLKKDILFETKSFEHIPQEIWNAFENQENSHKFLARAVQLFDVAKWRVDKEQVPMKLEQLPVDEKLLYSFDYFSHIDIRLKELRNDASKVDDIAVLNPVDKREHLDLLDEIIYYDSLKESLKPLVKEPLENSADETLLSFRAANDSITTYDDAMMQVYERELHSVSSKIINEIMDKEMKKAGVPEAYREQLMDKSVGFYDKNQPKFKLFLLQNNSNAFGEWTPKDDFEKNMSVDWFKDYVSEYFQTLIDSMGKVDEIGNKWQDPHLYSLKKRLNSVS